MIASFMPMNHTLFMAKNAIGRQGLTIILGISIVLLALSSAIILPFEYGRRMRLIEREIANIVQAQLPGLEEGVWNYDTRLVDAMVDGLAIYPYIIDIAVVDAAGPVISSRNRLPEGREENENPKYSHTYSLFNSEESLTPTIIGWLYFNIDSSRILNDVFSQIAATLAFQLAFIIIQSILVLIVFSRLITRHLATIARHVSEYRQDGSLHTLRLNRKERNDELGVLVDALNTLHSSLEEALSAERAVKENLEHSLEEKKVLLQEIYHRTKNNMQLIAALLDIQAMSLEEGPARNMLAEMTGRIMSMALVHQKLYESQDLSRLDIGEYIEDLIKEIQINEELDPSRIHFEVSVIHDVILVLDVAIPLGLAINELVTNAIKHAFPEGREGTISIYMVPGKNADELELSIRDNGVGFPNDFNLNRDSKLGLQTVINLIEQLYGTVYFNNDGGVRCTMTIQKNSYQARV